jgi:hypothetical protein
MIKVTFNARAKWQSLDCLYCGNQATLQADAKKGNVSASIRCCSDPKCKDLAEISAKDCVEAGYRQITSH